jgi:hypothetical protein
MTAARIEDGRQAVREYEAEHGPLPAHEREEAWQALAAYGLTHDAHAPSRHVEAAVLQCGVEG